MTTKTQPRTARLTYNRTIGVAAMQGRGFYYPWSGTVADDGKIYILGRGSDSDPRGVRVTVMTLEEEYLGTFGSFGTGTGQAIWNAGIAIDSQQRLFTSDEHLNRIMVRTLDGELLDTWGESGTEEGQLNGPNGIAFNSNDELLVSDHLNGRLQKFTGDGKHLATFGEPGAGNGQLNLPWGVCVDADDDVYVADWGNDRIVKYSADGKFLANFGSSGRGNGEFDAPADVCVDTDGYIYVADWGNQRIQVLDSDGGFVQLHLGEATISKWAQDFLDTNVEEAAARARADLELDIEFNTDDPHEQSAHIEKFFWGPTSLMLDNDGHLLVVDSNRHRIQVFDVS
ncbi:MAG: NHL repeat-containing protein [Chloroflexi bacterium]|nr:NHL repeat-containing protein [Chloroflexota bacterium]